jgi:hypothetical protein
LSDISAGATEEMVTAAPRADVAGLGVHMTPTLNLHDSYPYLPLPYTTNAKGQLSIQAPLQLGRKMQPQKAP